MAHRPKNDALNRSIDRQLNGLGKRWEDLPRWAARDDQLQYMQNRLQEERAKGQTDRRGQWKAALDSDAGVRRRWVMCQGETEVQPTTWRIVLLNEGRKEWTDLWCLPHPTDPLFYHGNPRQDNVNRSAGSNDGNDNDARRGADADDTRHHDGRRRKPRHSERGTDDDRGPEGHNNAMRVGTGQNHNVATYPKLARSPATIYNAARRA